MHKTRGYRCQEVSAMSAVLYLGTSEGVVTLCRDNGLPIRVFKMAPGNIKRVCLGEDVGTTVSE